MPGDRSVLIVGPVTWDVFPDGRRTPGGTVSFAARTAAAMGVRAQILTMAAPDADLTPLEGHDVHVIPAAATLTFAHTFDSKGVRTLRLVCAPERTLDPEDVPTSWPPPDTLLAAPLLPTDINAAGFAAVAVTEYGVTAQGLLRDTGPDGIITASHEPMPRLRAAVTARATVFVSEDEVTRWADRDVAELTRSARRLVITHGHRGAEIRDRDGVRGVPALPAAPVDSTGAGDVFATAFILALGEGEATAAHLAAGYAAAKVEVVGPAPLPSRPSIERRLSDGRGDA